MGETADVCFVYDDTPELGYHSEYSHESSKGVIIRGAFDFCLILVEIATDQQLIYHDQFSPEAQYRWNLGIFKMGTVAYSTYMENFLDEPLSAWIDFNQELGRTLGTDFLDYSSNGKSEHDLEMIGQVTFQNNIYLRDSEVRSLLAELRCAMCVIFKDRAHISHIDHVLFNIRHGSNRHLPVVGNELIEKLSQYNALERRRVARIT